MTLLFYRIPAQRAGSESETILPVRPHAGGLALVRDQRPFPMTIEDTDATSPTVRLATVEGAFIASRAVIEHVIAAPE